MATFGMPIGGGVAAFPLYRIGPALKGFPGAVRTLRA